MSRETLLAGSPASWQEAAESLAARVTRRERLGRLLTPLGVGLATGGLAAVLLGWALPGLAPWLGVAAGGVAGLAIGILRARRTAAHTTGPAAWALDRLGDAQGRGLTAAMVEGPRASEAAFVAPRLDAPPPVRLLPPRGVLPLAAGVLAALLGGIVGGRIADESAAAASQPRIQPRSGQRSGAGASPEAADAAPALEARAAEVEREVAAETAAIEALGLDPESRPTRAAIEDRLADPERRAQAIAAAEGDVGLRSALEGAGADAGAAVEALRRVARARAETERLRREAAAARGPRVQPVLSAERRALVARYEAIRHARLDASRDGNSTEKERQR